MESKINMKIKHFVYFSIFRLWSKNGLIDFGSRFLDRSIFITLIKIKKLKYIYMVPFLNQIKEI